MLSCLWRADDSTMVQIHDGKSSAACRAAYLRHCHSELLCCDGVYSMMAGDSASCKVWGQHASNDVLAQSAVHAMQSLGWPCTAATAIQTHEVCYADGPCTWACEAEAAKLSC